jgi:hypothetical protein
MSNGASSSKHLVTHVSIGFLKLSAAGRIVLANEITISLPALPRAKGAPVVYSYYMVPPSRATALHITTHHPPAPIETNRRRSCHRCAPRICGNGRPCEKGPPKPKRKAAVQQLSMRLTRRDASTGRNIMRNSKNRQERRSIRKLLVQDWRLALEAGLYGVLGDDDLEILSARAFGYRNVKLDIGHGLGPPMVCTCGASVVCARVHGICYFCCTNCREFYRCKRQLSCRQEAHQ